MLSLRAQVQAVNFLQLLTQGGEQVERARQHLAQLTSFEPYQAFRRLDRSGAGRISPTDLVHFMRARNCQVSMQEAEQLIKELSPSDPLGICYGDFIGAVLSWNNASLRKLAIEGKGLEGVGQDVEYGLCLFFEKELDLVLRSQRSVEQMTENPDFSVQNWFQAMDLDGDGLVDVSDVKQFAGRVGVSLRDSDIRTAFQWLDKDRDGALTLTDLQRTFKHDSVLSTRPGLDFQSSPIRSVSPLKSSSPLRSASPLRSVSPSLLRKDRSPQPSARLATPSQSAETVSNSHFFRGSRREDDSATQAVRAYFKCVLALEKDQRQLQACCHPSDLLRLLGRPGKVLLSAKDLESACRGLGLHLSLGECRDLVERVDEDRDSCMNESELCKLLLGPRERFTRQSAFGSLEALLANVICGLLEVEKARKRVFGAKLSDLYAVFSAMDTDHDGFVTRRDLNEQMSEAGPKVSFFDFLSDLTPAPLFRPVLL